MQISQIKDMETSNTSNKKQTEKECGGGAAFLMMSCERAYVELLSQKAHMHGFLSDMTGTRRCVINLKMGRKNGREKGDRWKERTEKRGRGERKEEGRGRGRRGGRGGETRVSIGDRRKKREEEKEMEDEERR